MMKLAILIMMRILTQSLSLKYLIMGGCFKDGSNGNLQKCAWEPSQCDAGSFFRAHDNNPRIMKECNPIDESIGRCVIEDQCAFRASDCKSAAGDNDSSGGTSSTNFVVNDPACTIERDIGKVDADNNPKFTQFGSCKNTETGDHFCILDPSDCEESGAEFYVNPSETKAAGIDCNCSEVHVTGCLTAGGETFCAINNQACRANSVTVSPHTQRLNRSGVGGGLDCRLCKGISTAATNMPTLSPTEIPTRSPTKTPTHIPTTSTPTKIPSDSSIGRRNTTAWTVVGVASVGVLAVFL